MIDPGGFEICKCVPRSSDISVFNPEPTENGENARNDRNDRNDGNDGNDGNDDGDDDKPIPRRLRFADAALKTPSYLASFFHLAQLFRRLE